MDLASEAAPAGRADPRALMTAIRPRPSASSSPRATSETYGLLVILPIYDDALPQDTTEQRRCGAGRVLIAVFGSPTVASWQRGAAAADLGLRITDTTDRLKAMLLIGAAQSAGAMAATVPLRLAGRRWTLALVPGPRYQLAHRSWQAWSILAAALLFTSFLGAVLLVTSGRTSRLAELEQRTRYLAASDRALASEIARRQEGEEALKISQRKLEELSATAKQGARRMEELMSDLAAYKHGQHAAELR